MAIEIFKCQCGQRLTVPFPEKCPQCGLEIVGVRKSVSPMLLTIISIVVLFGGLIFLTIFLAKYLTATS